MSFQQSHVQHIFKSRIHPELWEKIQDFDIHTYPIDTPSDRDFKKLGLDELIVELAPDVFAFQLLTEEFCLQTLEETEEYVHQSKTGWSKFKDKEASRVFLDLDRLGDQQAVDFIRVLDKAVYPLVTSLFDFGINWYEMPFISKYIAEKNRAQDLPFLHDQASDVTLQIVLSKDLSDGGIEFIRQKYKAGPTLKMGTALLYPGRITHPYRIVSPMKQDVYLLTVWMTDGRDKRSRILGWR